MNVPKNQQQQPDDNDSDVAFEAKATISRRLSSLTKHQSRGKLGKHHPKLPRTFVDNSYRDHAQDPLSNSDRKMQQANRGGISITFPQKLFNMLTAAATEGFDHIVSWQPHGRCFLIHDKHDFGNTIIPKYVPMIERVRIERVDESPST